MRIAVLALLGGAAVAVALGGRPGSLRTDRLRRPTLPFVAVILYWAPVLLDASPPAALALVVFSYAALLAFALANLRLTGMAVVGLGLALNALVIVANGGMPVDPQAVVATGLAGPDELAAVDLGAARQWQEPGDRLGVLGDIVPVAVLDEVVSFGDLVLAAGLANVAFRLFDPTATRHRPGPFRREGRGRRPRLGLPAGPWAPAR